MKFVLLIAATAWLAARGHAQGAAILWCVAVALLHAAEEGRGRLWAYFGEIAGSPFFTHCQDGVGFALIAAPALLLQSAAAWLALSGDVSAFWLALLIGARIGDAVFSHAIPFAHGEPPVTERLDPGYRVQLNPGLATAAVYLADGIILLFAFGPHLSADPFHAVVGAAIGAGFFAAVIPGLKLTRWM